MDSFRAILPTITDAFGRLPPDVVGVLILLFAILLALSVHRWVRRLVRHFLAQRSPYAFSIFVRMRGLTQFALLILFGSIALSVAPFSPPVTGLLARFLLLATIALVGWSAFTALNLAADLY